MPDRLKSILVDDWENVTKQLQLVSLPAKYPASIILDEYMAYAEAPGMRSNAEIDILREVIHGLKEYFNKALGRLLLYRFEREQFFDYYSAINLPTGELAGKTVADIYGGEHLLRLFGNTQFCPAYMLSATVLT
jgi:mortality factor 4-like protein 1